MAEHSQKRRGDQCVRRGGAARGLERTLAPQYREHRFRHESAVVLAEVPVLAEVARQELVGRRVTAQDHRSGAAGVREQRARHSHGDMRVTTCS